VIESAICMLDGEFVQVHTFSYLLPIGSAIHERGAVGRRAQLLRSIVSCPTEAASPDRAFRVFFEDAAKRRIEPARWQSLATGWRWLPGCWCCCPARDTARPHLQPERPMEYGN
jgi:hypothetical protein